MKLTTPDTVDSHTARILLNYFVTQKVLLKNLSGNLASRHGDPPRRG